MMKALNFLMYIGLSIQANATVISSFETGNWDGWEVLGDTSIQDSGLGASPTDGNYQGLITTLCDRNLGSHCQTTLNELTYSGTNAVHQYASTTSNGKIYDFLGLDFLTDVSPIGVDAHENGEGSAIKKTITGKKGDVLSFDYNFLTTEGTIVGDYSFLTIVSDSSEFTFTLVLPLNTLLGTESVSGVDLWDQIEGANPDLPLETTQTGYRSASVALPFTGDYILGFSVSEREEGTIPSALLVDNIQLTAIPETATLFLMTTGLAGLGFAGRRKKTA